MKKLITAALILTASITQASWGSPYYEQASSTNSNHGMETQGFSKASGKSKSSGEFGFAMNFKAKTEALVKGKTDIDGTNSVANRLNAEQK